jgi:hypothetical protein
MVFEKIKSKEIFSNLLTSLTFGGGSDETRTRDLRRDRLLSYSPTPVIIKLFYFVGALWVPFKSSFARAEHPQEHPNTTGTKRPLNSRDPRCFCINP